jgi:acetyl esterase/lipase
MLYGYGCFDNIVYFALHSCIKTLRMEGCTQKCQFSFFATLISPKIKSMKPFISLVLMMFLLQSCQKETATPNDTAAKTELNTAYGTQAQQKMDIYLPQGRTENTTKAIILIHGGGWSGGDKSDLTPYIDTLKKRLPGYAIFNINYRLAAGSSNQFPTQEMDVKAALEFIYSKKSEYKITDKWALLGTSAGAHLSLLQAYKYTNPVKIKAVVDFYGPTDMIEMYNNPASILVPPALVQGVVGATPTSNLSLYQASSPVNYVNNESCPTILLHGGADVIVSVNQSILLRNKLQRFSVSHQYVLYASENHGWVGANLTDSFDKIVAFLTTHVN